MGEDSLITH